jgi:hypothetical protein
MNFSTGGPKPEGKTEAMLIWVEHPDPEVDRKSKY